MLKFLERIQKRPEHERKKLLYVLMAFFGVIIITVWLTTLPFDIFPEKKSVPAPDNGPSPFALFGEQLRGFAHDFSAGIREIKEAIPGGEN